MVTIDFSDFGRWAKELEMRATALQQRPFAHCQAKVESTIKELFHEVLSDNEHITLSEQIKHYKQTGRGYYGTDSGGHNMAMVNPQEDIDPGTAPLAPHQMGKGRLFRDSSIRITQNASGVDIDLYSGAEMKPYPHRNKDGTFSQLSTKPIAQYFREGWNYPVSNHHMEKRPFGRSLAKIAAERGTLGTLLPDMLESAGFRKK
jgi:hypothetical protein